VTTKSNRAKSTPPQVTSERFKVSVSHAIMRASW
jgi:hypothetical protein